jgi:hypothetical protein
MNAPPFWWVKSCFIEAKRLDVGVQRLILLLFCYFFVAQSRGF